MIRPPGISNRLGNDAGDVESTPEQKPISS